MTPLETSSQFLSAEYWDNRYRTGQTAWDIGSISTPLKTYIDQLTNKNLRILIPGAGNSYEARYLAQNGFSNIVIIDISTALTAALQTKFRTADYPNITIITGDFFTLKGEYDLILEQTFFCAINPILRIEYVATMQKLLSNNGRLVGLLFNKTFDSNPPFGGNIEKYRQLFSNGLRIIRLEPCMNSIPARNGSELFLIAEKSSQTDFIHHL